jgi:uncharacterized protein
MLILSSINSKPKQPSWYFLWMMVFALTLSACSPKTRPAKFYLLQPITQPSINQRDTEISHAKLIGVGPVEIPAYLDRPQIVTGGGGAEIQLDEFQRWGEPLRDNITHVLTENLSALIPGNHLLAFPWNRNLVLDYQVEVQITRFHVDAEGHCELKAQWSIIRQNKSQWIKEFQEKIAVSGEDYGAKVAAQSKLLVDLSKAIAEGLKAFVQEP